MTTPKPIDRKYSKLTFSQANDDLKQIVVSKGGSLADVGSASYVGVFREMLSAHSDVLGYWLESSFNNSWLESASSNEAVYVGARSLGYSIRRAVPAKAGFNVKLKRTGSNSTVKIVVPKGTVFNVAGNVMTAIDDVEFSYDRNDPDYESGLMKLISGRAVLAEGTFKSYKFFSNGSKFQEFLLLDTSASNWFGDNDPNYIESDKMSDRINRFTSVTTDSGLVDNFTPVIGHEEQIFWRIDRRGLIDPDAKKTINDLETFTSDGNSTLNYSCLITTANDGRIKLEFGDGIIAAIPYGEITLNYFSTKGVAGTATNVAGSKMSTSARDILIVQDNGMESDLTLDDITFALTTDIVNGLDIESVESIKANASSVFNSLDSLGNRTSYNRYLRSVSDVRYSIAYGEDILSRYSTGIADIKYSNIVRFSILKDLYRERDGKYYVTDPSEYYVPGYKVNGLVNLWDYDYSNLPDSKYMNFQDASIDTMKQLMTYNGLSITDNKGTSITVDDFIAKYVPKLPVSLVPSNVFSVHMTPKDYVEMGSELYNLMDSLDRRGYLTLGNGQHSYVPPTVHDLGIDIEMILFDGSNFSDIKTSALNNIYSYLQDNTKFSHPIFRSEIECLIQRLPETAGVNIKFKSIPNGYNGLELDKLTWMSYPTSRFVNTVGLSDTGIPMQFTFDNYLKHSDGTLISSGTLAVPIAVMNQNTIRSQIRGYYITKIAYIDDTGSYQIRKNVTEHDLTEFTAYIWSIAMNEMYSSLLTIYSDYSNIGNVNMKSSIYQLTEVIRTWNFQKGQVSFTDNDYIKNLVESTGNLFKYMVYTLDYIKLVRNIISPVIAGNLIDENGNVTRYSDSHEIVQFHVAPADFKITYGTDKYGRNA